MWKKGGKAAGGAGASSKLEKLRRSVQGRLTAFRPGVVDQVLGDVIVVMERHWKR